jgi:hypothetical protein
MNKLLTALAVPALLLMMGSGCASKEKSDQEEEAGGANPYLSAAGETNFATLINNFPEGVPAEPGWANSFWPYTSNGIASNAYSHTPSGPAGKYDSARGGTKHAQEWEIRNHGPGVKGVQGWWGHCNGWTASSSLYPEPKEPIKINGITFNVGDQKALLAEAGMSASADFFGNRVDPWTREYHKAWEDTAPDQYFLVLTNFMGKGKHSVLIDRDPGDQIWNQPLAGYRFKYPTKQDDLGCTNGVCKINVSSKLWWYNDSGVPGDVITPEFKWDEDGNVIIGQDYEMEVWLDGPIVWDAEGKKIVSSGNVIVARDDEYFVGGAWKNGSTGSHPDYMWVAYSLYQPEGNDDYANPEVDVEWLKQHMLVRGGADDTSVRPLPEQAAPSPRPTASPSPDPHPTSTPYPVPPITPRPRP